ncbi:MAG: GAF domain-containing protein [Bradymonadales bacterium]|nr:GAF domain-containing protein [Bradymonadales bacterium]
MSVQSLSYLVAAFISCALAIGILIRSDRNRLSSAFGILNGVLFLHYLCSFLYGLSGRGFWYRVTILAALAVPIAAIRFFTLFLGHRMAIAAKARQTSYVISVLLTPFVLSGLVYRLFIRIPIFVYVFSSLLLCMLLIIDRLRQTTSRVESARLKYLFYGGLAAVLLSMSDYLPRIDIPWLPLLGNLTTVVYMYFLHQVIIQYRLLDLNELVGKLLVLAILVTVLAVIYILIGIWVSHIPSLVIFNTFIAGFVILILFEPINRLVEHQTNRLLFRERNEFSRKLVTLRRELANVIDVSNMAQLVLSRLEDSRRVTGASLYLLDEETSRLRCLGYSGPPPSESVDAVSERPFLDRLQAAGALVIEAVEAELRGVISPSGDPNLAESDACNETIRMLRALEADVTIPMISEGRVLGLFNLRDERVRDSFSPDEIAQLVAIANQAAICVENSQIVKRIRDRDRLAAVGEMAAGLAHEVRNPLGAIKGAAQLLSDGVGEGIDRSGREFLDIIVEEVNRLNTVVSAFLDYARPFDGVVEPTEVNQVIDRVFKLLASPAEKAKVTVELELAEGLPPAAIYPEVLRQVLWNLALNAVEAMEETDGGQLVVKTRPGSRMAAQPHSGYFGHESIEISISDSGPGIAPADQDRVFIPFYTTKPKGTGLGLPICQRLIRGVGGTIRMSSQQGEGTTFTIRLPLWRAERVTPTPLGG